MQEHCVSKRENGPMLGELPDHGVGLTAVYSCRSQGRKEFGAGSYSAVLMKVEEDP